MQMLNRYIEAVAKKLPLKMRGDVSSEIRSTIEDMLEDRRRESPGEPEEIALEEVLRSYGSPESVAATYLPEKYLVGPQLYPIFWLVIKITFAVLTVLALVGLGFALSGGNGLSDLLRISGKSLASYYTSLITAFGNIVLVFAVLQRVLPASEIGELDPGLRAWDPRDLLKEPSKNEIKPWEPIMTILVTFAGLVIFNFYPQLLRYTPSLNEIGSDRVVWLPIFSEAFFSYLPWLNVLWVLQIGLGLFQLRTRRWNAGMCLVSIALRVMWIGIAIAMLRGPALLNLSAEALAAWPVELEGLKELARFLETIVRFFLGLGIFGSFVDIVKDGIRMFRLDD